MIQGNLLPHLRSPNGEHIVVCALPSELPEALPESLLFTGVGKLNATYALTRYLERHPEIRTVINYGTCGGAYQVKPSSLVQATTFLQGDMDCGTSLASGPGITFGDDEAISGIINFGTEGVICRTQDQFVENYEALDLFEHLITGNKFNIVDMEAYALAKVCAMMSRDFICYKFVSDTADEDAAKDWQENVAKGEPLFYEKLKTNHGFTHIK
jgi:adenosylhomocysteine nucleosidase